MIKTLKEVDGKNYIKRKSKLIRIDDIWYPIDKKFLNLFSKVTEEAAIGASKFIGKKDKIAADKGAVDPMKRVK